MYSLEVGGISISFVQRKTDLKVCFWLICKFCERFQLIFYSDQVYLLVVLAYVNLRNFINQLALKF